MTPATPRDRRPLPRWLPAALVTGGWLTIGLISSSLTYATWRGEGLSMSWGLAQWLLLPYWLFWAPMTPVVLALSRRFPLDGAHWPRALPVHLVAATACGLLHVVLYVVLYKLSFPWPPQEPGGPAWTSFIVSMLRSRWQTELIVYAGILGAGMAIRFAREAEARALAAAQLETQLAQAQLAALRMQLNPHFLFNTLQAVSVLVTEDPRRAQHVLALLGDLLRAVLDGRGRQEVPLREELDFLRRYLEIETTRFPDRLRVVYDVDAATLGLLVPSFVLQPLVENAIRYAVAPRAAPGTVTIGASRAGEVLTLRVRDDGPGVPTAAGEGVGLATTRERLAKLYGADHHFSLGAHGAGPGAEVMVELPARAEAAGDHG